MKFEKLPEEEIKRKQKFRDDHSDFIDGKMGYIFTDEDETKSFFNEIRRIIWMDSLMYDFEKVMVEDCKKDYVVMLKIADRTGNFRARREKKEDCENYIVFRSNKYEVDLI